MAMSPDIVFQRGTASAQLFVQLIEALRREGCELVGTPAQMAKLISDALAIIEPDTDGAIIDSASLMQAFESTAALLGGEVEYPEFHIVMEN
jgi:hypothetical protein